MPKPQLSDALADFNLHQAWSKVYENQGCAGVDGQTLMDFAEHLLVNLDTLRNEARYGTYRPQPLLRVAIDKPGGGKRLLSIPSVRDRILQTAVTLVVEPVFEAEFEDCSFAYRKGRSADQAIARVQSLQRQGYQWVVDADIQAFFDNIDHTLLLLEIGRLIPDPDLQQLIRLWLKATVFDNGQPFELHKGVPQGSPIAPLLSNLYLNHLDEALLDDNACRVRQPPTDGINALLSYGYTLLFYNVYSLLRSRGLNPHVGFLHALRQGHPALASDIMEEFRALVVDAVVLNLALNGRLSPDDFDYPKAPGEPSLPLS